MQTAPKLQHKAKIQMNSMRPASSSRHTTQNLSFSQQTFTSAI